ncbi:peptidoglycan-binding protein [Alicyclobacillus tolerans]|uniref:peptidoglycan-binding protein n=1 Tax=Alicyclobacillus tolerans TaxID=90970 RepID=UPI001F166DA6|nr:peptidoglycan-binding protein [Alicyclobacillus tolerans]MCF8567884.1 peptidoglycan-binding protein [Alicyclobacillus tolerans]
MKKFIAVCTLPALFSMMAAPTLAEAATTSSKPASSTTTTNAATKATKAASSSTGSGSTTLTLKNIYNNGKLTERAYGLVSGGTTYMPIWYVMQVLQSLGIQSTWKDGHWKMTVPSSYKLDLTHLPQVHTQTSNTQLADISLNGTVVAQMTSIVHVDPSSNQPTTFMPIWYVQQALKRVGIASTWDGVNWKMTPAAKTKTSTSSTSGSGSTKTGSTGSSGSTTGSSSSTGSSGSSSGNTPAPAPVPPKPPAPPTPPTPPAPPHSTVPGSSNFALELGDSGTYVQQLQHWLTFVGFFPESNGTFGPNTQAAVKGFQQADQLPVTGIVDQATWDALSKFITSLTTPPSTTNTSGSSTGSSTTTTTTPPPSTSGGFTNVDLRYPAPSDISTNSINSFLQQNGSPLTGLGQSFMDAQNTYGVDANYLVSHAILESAWGKSQIALAKSNLFGYGAYDSNPGIDAGMFPSDDYAIRFEAWEVRNNYLNPGASLYVSPTLNGMNVHYATDPHWASSIGSIMGQFASSVNDSVSSYPQFTGNLSAPAPQSTTEPVYFLNGAQGVIQSDPSYHGAPYYPTAGAGMSDMFFGSISASNNSFGSNVSAVQRYLNQTMNAGLTVDGSYGPMTETAIKNFQTAHNLPVNGVWDFSMWNLFNPMPSIIPANTTVTVDQMMQGMAGGLVIEWYHIPNYGWVNSEDVKLTNAYRIAVPNPTSTQTSVPVYNPSNPSQVIATLHNGDLVTSTNPQGNGQNIPIQFANEQTGAPMNGVILSSQANLTAQN